MKDCLFINYKSMLMKKRFFGGLTFVLAMFSASFAQQATFMVQGHERSDLNPLPIKKGVSASEAKEGDPFTFNDIECWVGEGENKAALIIDWQLDSPDHALVWGFRWDGKATGIDMLMAVAKADPRFVLLTHETNLGNTVAGIGFDIRQNGNLDLVYTPSSGGESVTYMPENGIVLTDAYNYDDWSAADGQMLWCSGWYNGYWSYQVKDDLSGEYVYSSYGASSRELTDGCADGWSYALISGGFSGSLPREPVEAVLPVAVEGISLNRTVTALEIGKETVLTATVNPATAMNRNCTWTSSNQEVASVSDQGVVRALSAGKTVITVKTEDGGFEAECTVNVLETVPTEENVYWGQMYKNAVHQSVIDMPLAITAGNLSVKWEYNFGGYNGQPIIAGDLLYNTCGKKIYAISVKDGSLVSQGDLAGTIGFFSMIAFGDGKIFVTMNSGLIQAFDAVTLESLWQAKISKGSQQLCPIVYHDGYVYTGTWSGGSPATGVFYCLSTQDEDPEDGLEYKEPVWESPNVGFYWSGGTIVGDCIFVGGDDGLMRSYNRLTGEVVDEWTVAPDLATSTIRSGTSYDEETGRLFFTAKEAKKIYSVKINADGTFDEDSKMSTDIAGQATTTPTVYNGRVYATSGTMTSGGGFDVFDARTLEKIYTVDMGGISQSTPVVSTAFATEENKQKVYVYVCLNNNTGDLVCIEDFEGNTEPILKYRYQAPSTQYCTHSVVVDQYGTLYYKNDSKGFWALESHFDVEGVRIDQTELTLAVSAKETLKAIVEPHFATNRNCTWTSSNQEVASVSDEGLVHALSVGEATITVKTEDGGFEAVCLLTVNDQTVAVTGVSLDHTEATLEIGEELVLTATVSPQEATNKDCIWTSSNQEVASVNAEGLVTALSAGEATITVKTEDGGFEAVCLITVPSEEIPIAVSGISLNMESDSLHVGDTVRLVATVMPENAANRNCTWTSSNEEVAGVSETGLVTALTEGETVITVKTEDGGFEATCKITVTDAQTGDTTAVRSAQPLAVTVYPNPTSSLLNIRLEEKALIEIFAMNGCLVQRKEASSGLHTFDLEGSGLYLIRISSGGRSVLTRVVRR